jgi:UDP-glucuronate decarboxylase
MDTNYLGTKNLLEIAKKHNSAFIQASTSEVYGDPKINPQDEMYFGNVNTTGVRSCYDEGKRIAETLCYEYNKTFGVNTKIIRIFNTYGPLMDINDGRVITNFFLKALMGFPIEIYGDGKQTRSFCYIDDLINGLIKCKDVDFNYPINLGNDNEISLNELAKKFSKIFSNLKINHINSAEDDPKIRRPDISRAKKILDWKPKYSLDQGLNLSYEYFKEVIKK